MGFRRQAREAALGFLYQMDAADKLSFENLMSREPQSFLRHFLGETKHAEFYMDIVLGVMSLRSKIDDQIQEVSEHWKIGRMERVDRCLLRIATWELMLQPETPEKVILDEAVELAKKYSTVESSRFVNGLLDELVKKLRKSEPQ